MKPGDYVWVPVKAAMVMGDGGVWFTDLRGFKVQCHKDLAQDAIPDSPMLPAVARWLAALPDWIDAAELATALESVLASSKEAQAMTCGDDVPLGYARHNEFVEAAEAIQPHGWEALESLIAALTEGQA